MRVISNEVLAVENGTYSATVFDYGEDKVCMKFQMEDGTILVKFFSSEDIWNTKKIAALQMRLFL